MTWEPGRRNRRSGGDVFWDRPRAPQTLLTPALVLDPCGVSVQHEHQRRPPTAASANRGAAADHVSPLSASRIDTSTMGARSAPTIRLTRNASVAARARASAYFTAWAIVNTPTTPPSRNVATGERLGERVGAVPERDRREPVDEPTHRPRHVLVLAEHDEEERTGDSREDHRTDCDRTGDEHDQQRARKRRRGVPRREEGEREPRDRGRLPTRRVERDAAEKHRRRGRDQPEEEAVRRDGTRFEQVVDAAEDGDDRGSDAREEDEQEGAVDLVKRGPRVRNVGRTCACKSRRRIRAGSTAVTAAISRS